MVTIYNSIDFYTLSVLSGVDLKTLYFLNPGFSAWYIIPSMQNKILLPIKNKRIFDKRYKKYRELMMKEKIHTVAKGDTLSKISRIYNVKIDAIKIKNSLSSDLIKIGQKLNLPIKVTSSDKNNIKINGIEYQIVDSNFNYYHTVKRYDNWYKIARFYDVRLKSLLSWNNAKKDSKLFVGNKVKIQMRTPILSNDKKIKLRYVVNTGDTTNMLATGFSINKEDLLSSNKIKNSRYLVAGKNLSIEK